MSEMTSKHPRRPGSRRKSLRTIPQQENRPNPMTHMGFSGARHLIPERMPSARRETTVGLRVIDLNQDTVDNIKELSPTLRRLDLSALNLVRLTEDFTASLEGLERFDLADNELNDDAFPASFQNLKQLHDLNLHNNKLTCLPKQVRRLKELNRLKIGSNKLESVSGIERLKKLQILMLQNNSLEHISREMLSNLRKLEIFHCAQNNIKDVPIEIRYLRHLKDLDIAGNKLSTLPPELLLLPRLEVLSASNNLITRVPTINVKGRLNRKLASIDLSDNKLIKFPEHLLFMTEKLDLCKNRIKAIPLSVLKKMDPSSDQELMLSGNPWQNPPREVCECGIRAIVQYFQEARADIKTYQGIKVLMLGASGSGKTSLIQSLVDQQARVTPNEDSTVGVDMYEIDHTVQMMEEDKRVEDRKHRTDDDHKHRDGEDTESHIHDSDGDKVRVVNKNLLISLWDFSGHPQYLYSNYFFLHDPAIIVLTFNMSTYSEAEFSKSIGSWLDWIVTKTNKLVILPVGTMADLVPPAKASEICQSVSHLIDVYIQNYKESIEGEIKKIESRPHISTVLSDQLKSYIHLLKVQTFVHSSVVAVSSLEYSGMDALLSAIESMALNTDMFPNVLRVIPCLWTEVENYIEDKSWSMQIPFMTWDAYCLEVTNKFGMKHLMKQITQYLHDVGKVIWYSNNEHLKNFVFLRPSWLSDVMKQLFRHNVADIDYNMDESFKQNNLTLDKFNRIIQQVTDEGIIDREFLRGAWNGLVQSDSTKQVVEVIVMLLENFELGYPFVKPGGNKTPTPSVNSQRRESRPSIDTRLSAMSNYSVFSEAPSSISPSRPQSPSKERPRSRSSRPGSRSGVESARADSQLGEEKKGKKKNKKEQVAEVPKINKLVVPWRRDLTLMDVFLEEYKQYETSPALAVLYKFPTYAPPGFFETMCVRALKEQMNFAVLYHWDKNMYAEHQEKPYRLRLQQIREGKDTLVRIELRHNEAEADVKEVENIWFILLPYLKEVEQLLTHFQGARVERWVECPECADRGFLGEWLSPKDLQGSVTRECESCKKHIPVCYLIQPKEKKRVEEFLLRKLKREASKREMKEEHEDNTTPPTQETKQVDSQPNKQSINPENGQTEDDNVTFNAPVRAKTKYFQPCRDINDIEVDFDDDQFLQELQENCLAASYIYDTGVDDSFIGKRGRPMRVTAVQTDY